MIVLLVNRFSSLITRCLTVNPLKTTDRLPKNAKVRGLSTINGFFQKEILPHLLGILIFLKLTPGFTFKFTVTPPLKFSIVSTLLEIHVFPSIFGVSPWNSSSYIAYICTSKPITIYI